MTEFAPNGNLLNYLRGIRSSYDLTAKDVLMTYWWTRARALISDLFSFSLDIANALLYLEDISVGFGSLFFIASSECRGCCAGVSGVAVRVFASRAIVYGSSPGDVSIPCSFDRGSPEH